jgi:hypothetical protein
VAGRWPFASGVAIVLAAICAGTSGSGRASRLGRYVRHLGETPGSILILLSFYNEEPKPEWIPAFAGMTASGVCCAERCT